MNGMDEVMQYAHLYIYIYIGTNIVFYSVVDS